MEHQFVTGDKVRLTSGGPVMTVRGTHYDVVHDSYNNNMVDCIWFEKKSDGRSEVQYCPFNVSELVPVPPSC